MMHRNNRFNNSSEDATNAAYRDEYSLILGGMENQDIAVHGFHFYDLKMA